MHRTPNKAQNTQRKLGVAFEITSDAISNYLIVFLSYNYSVKLIYNLSNVDRMLRCIFI